MLLESQEVSCLQNFQSRLKIPLAVTSQIKLLNASDNLYFAVTISFLIKCKTMTVYLLLFNTVYFYYYKVYSYSKKENVYLKCNKVLFVRVTICQLVFIIE